MITFRCLTEKVGGEFRSGGGHKKGYLLNYPAKNGGVEESSFLCSLVGPALKTACFLTETLFYSKTHSQGRAED